MLMASYFISVTSRCGNTNLNYMITSFLHSLLSYTVNRESNNVYIWFTFISPLSWMEYTHFLLGLPIGLALEDRFMNGSVKIINGFLGLLVRLDSITPTLHRTNWDQIWLKRWEMSAVFGCGSLSSFRFAVGPTWHVQVASADSYGSWFFGVLPQFLESNPTFGVSLPTLQRSSELALLLSYLMCLCFLCPCFSFALHKEGKHGEHREQTEQTQRQLCLKHAQSLIWIPTHTKPLLGIHKKRVFTLAK